MTEPTTGSQEDFGSNSAAQAALLFRSKGWAPIPLKVRSKAPKLSSGHPFLHRSAEDEEFAGFDFRHNIGVVAGKVSGIIVLDDDDGGETLRNNGWHVPATPTVKTKRGHQFYFRCPPEGFPSFDIVPDHLEAKGDGTYVVAPPSVHPSGDRYEWTIAPDEAELADPPEWLLGLARARGRRNAVPVGETIPNGSRNRTLTRIGGTLRRPGLDEEAIFAALRGINAEKCQPPLEEAEVRQVARSVARYEPATSADVRPNNGTEEEHGPRPFREDDAFNLTDMGNAERLVHRHGDDLRYCPQLGGWFTWDETRWRPDVAGEVERRAKETVRAIYAEAGREDDEGRRKALADHARRSEARTRVEAMIALARTEAGIPRRAEEFDRDPWLLNCENGTLDLRTGELRDHRREDMITRVAGTRFDPQAEAPRFERFLREVLVEDDVIAFVRRFAGYSLSGSTRERVLAILHGRGRNGKSTLIELLQDVLGDYGTTTDTETILARRYQGVGNDVAALKGARFVAAAEVEKGRRLAESKVKQLTGSDTVSARFLYAEPFSFRPEFKLWLSTNNKPEIHGEDDAIWDRLRLIPFDRRFVGDAADPGLPEKLREELPGILRWMVRGCAEWLSEGLGEPATVKAATTAYRADMDTLAAFIEDRCVLDPNAWVRFSDLWAAYQDWSQDSGEKAETKRAFGSRLKERGFEPDRGTGNAPIRRGIGLRDDRDPDPQGGQRVTTVTDGAEGDSTVTGPIPHTYEGSDPPSYPSYPSYPKNHNFRPNLPRVDTFQKQGNSGNYGNSRQPEDDWVGLDDLVRRRAEDLGRCTGEAGCLCDGCQPA